MSSPKTDVKVCNCDDPCFYEGVHERENCGSCGGLV